MLHVDRYGITDAPGVLVGRSVAIFAVAVINDQTRDELKQIIK